MGVNIWIIAAPLVCALAVFLIQLRIGACQRADRLFRGVENDRKYLCLRTGFFACALVVYLSALELVASFYSGTGHRIPAAAAFTVSILCGAALAVRFNMREGRTRRLLTGLGRAALVIILLETVVFNAKSAGSDMSELADLSKAVFDTETAHFNNEGQIVIDKNSEVELFDVPEGTGAVVVNLIREDGKGNFHVVLKMKDNNFSEKYIDVGDTYWGGCHPAGFTIEPYGEVKSLCLKLYELRSEPVIISSVEYRGALAYSFSGLRFFGLLLITGLVIFIKAFGIANKTYDAGRLSHRAALLIVCTVCVMSVLPHLKQEYNFIDYPLEGGGWGKNPYVQTYDAFMNGRTWLDLPVDAGLEKLDNPYDPSARNEAGVSSRFDRAYYNGKYYSYFGVAPVILIMYPCGALFSKLPDNDLMVFVFCFQAVIFLCLALSEIVKTYVKKPNLLLYLLMYPCATFMCGVYFCLQYADQYNVAVSCGMCYLYMTLFFGFKAVNSKEGWKQNICLLFSGIGLAFSICARPTVALCALILAPAFLGFIFDKSKRPIRKILQAGYFLVPVFFGIALVLIYNHARFGSFFDFGAAHQMTVSDIHANHLRLSGIPGAIWHYFLQMPVQRAAFPFVMMGQYSMANYTMYVYNDKNVGLLWLPVITASFVLLKKSLSRRTCGKNGSSIILQRAFFIQAVVMGLLIAWMDFCVAGVNCRYLFDIIPLFIVISTCTVLRTTVRSARTGYKVVTGTVIATMLLIFALSIVNMQPFYYELLEDLLVFWR